ncbi:MBL fold metallo-hydrolase [Thalassobaculum sp.]|uniref:MBL fold metallo-hydrolase n=1 Tax=Thalassobaculum sp. TaxID=2022740 RepID=UPI003B5CF1C8
MLPGSIPGPTFDRLPTADNWFAIEWLPQGVLRIWEPHVSRLLRANMFLVRGRDRDLLVDAGMGVCSLRRFLDPFLDKPVVHVLSHAHVDHIGSAHEFAGDLRMHAAEADVMRDPPADLELSFDGYSAEKKERLRQSGFDVSGALIAAAPSPSFKPEEWRIPGATPTALLADGDTVDLGDRSFEVLHTPGHSPGSICLWEAATGILIGGDTIYDGLLIDTLPDSDPAAYAVSMRRLKQLNVSAVHGGHRESFGAAKYQFLIDQYLSS